ncbi:DEAD/DEAH box helicase, partial [Candidatus Woesearchaeota archaeon]|nr:DEAD/DEAH box helicase [Candidatus Woesearchaeota archaeon]
MEIKNMNLNSNLIQAVTELGYTEATGIQEKCIPEILAGKDVFGQSSTGSGKTAAFGLPILQRMQPNQGIQVLILTPTRELCVQVTDSLRDFAKYTKYKIISVYGGVSIQNQFEAIKTADIVVATPGRVLDHLERRSLKLNNIQYFVLDEADK